MNILIVEDEQKLRDELKKFLENNGYKVDTIIDFNDVYNYIINHNFDLILMDINLPNINGEKLTKDIRKVVNTPIIIVTSRNTDIDELLSLNYGADDFITKPYNPQILLARIERILMRKENTSTLVKYKNLNVDVYKSIMFNDTKTIDLSGNEIKILTYLLKNQGKIVSRDDIMSYLWDNNDFVDDNTLTVNINRLRNKLDDMGYIDMIVTKRGQGYIILWN